MLWSPQAGHPSSGLWEEAGMKRFTAVITGMLVGAGLAGCATGPSAGGWVALFDGRDTKQWYDIGGGNWRIESGVLVADGKKGKDQAFMVTNQFYKDFQLKVEFWASDDANSGIFMRCGNPEVINDKVCYEANIFDQRKDPSYGTGAVTNIAKVDPMPKAGGKWNTYDITLRGDHIVLILNGQKTVDVRNKAFSDGRIALQYDAGAVKFRKVEVRRL
jgi:hypothetical protein